MVWIEIHTSITGNNFNIIINILKKLTICTYCHNERSREIYIEGHKTINYWINIGREKNKKFTITRT